MNGLQNSIDKQQAGLQVLPTSATPLFDRRVTIKKRRNQMAKKKKKQSTSVSAPARKALAGIEKAHKALQLNIKNLKTAMGHPHTASRAKGHPHSAR